MPDLKLFKYATISKELEKIQVLQKTSSDGDKYTEYENAEKARDAYGGGEFRDKIKRWILSENLVVLTGAGTSITTTDTGGTLDENSIKYTGKSVLHIWEKCKEQLAANTVSKLQTELHEPEAEFQLERFISKIEVYVAANSQSANVATKAIVAQCNEARDKIIEILKEECNLTLHATAPHQKFLRDIMSARGDQSRLQLFTLNYDTLFEQASENINATIIDGFAFSRNPVFNGSNFDLDVVKRGKNRVQHNENYEEKVFQLFKLHGSLDWRKDEDTQKIVRVQDVSDSRDVIFIPPSVHKFEQSYEMPYFEMMSRFQQSLRRENTTLLILGYSFSDTHINRVIIEALNSNLNFEVVIVSPTATDTSTNPTVQELHQLIDNGQANITIIGDTFKRFTLQIPSIHSSKSKEPSTIEATEGDEPSEAPF